MVFERWGVGLQAQANEAFWKRPKESFLDMDANSRISMIGYDGPLKLTNKTRHRYPAEFHNIESCEVRAARLDKLNIFYEFNYINGIESYNHVPRLFSVAMIRYITTATKCVCRLLIVSFYYGSEFERYFRRESFADSISSDNESDNDINCDK